MKLLTLTLLALALLLFEVSARAEGNCPPGYYPIGGQGVQGCAPYPNQAQPQQQRPAPALQPQQWESRWGAIVTDGVKGVIGSASGMSGQAQAEQSAMADCQAKGGSDCKLAVSYANGCGAMVVGDKRFNVDRGSTEEAAIQASMKTCNAEDTNCRVYFTTCSLAKRIP